MSAAEAGNVKVVRGEWNAEFFAEAEDPSDHDDQLDAFAGACETALTKADEEGEVDLW